MNSKIWAIVPGALENIFHEKKAILQNAALINSLFSKAKQKENSVENGVAIINIENAIMRKTSWWSAEISYKEIKAEIQKALDNEEVKAIFYNIYSPGGTVAGNEELASFIKEAGTKKPSCAFVDGMCCSAAYWLASATGNIFATETAQVGSIGVVLLHGDYSKIYENVGVKYTYITAGSKKSIGASEIPLSDEDKEYLQNKVNGIYDVFLQNVAQNMGLNLDKKLEWADGRVFLGKEALSLGLVSKIVKTKEEALSLLLENCKENFMTISHTSQTAQTGAQTPQTVSAISEDLFAIVETVCGVENAQKVKNLAEAGLTKAQIEALSPVFSMQAKAEEQTNQDETNRQILAALMEQSPKAVNSVGAETQPDDKDNALIQRVGKLKQGK